MAVNHIIQLLMRPLWLQEAKESSEIENIITTHDDLFYALPKSEYMFGAAKEVINYKEALWRGIELIREKGLLTTNMIVEVQGIIEENKSGIRKQGGTKLINEKTGETVYTPPSTENEIRNLLGNLENYINGDDEVDPLIKLAVIHYQFESIHPFYDGDGRTGRIINELFLVMSGLLDSPILYLSKYILSTKEEYYSLLNDIPGKGNWEEWVLYILKGIQETSENSLDILFLECYTRISNVQKGLNVTRKTASNYLNALSESGILEVEVRGKDKLFINKRLLEIMKDM